MAFQVRFNCRRAGCGASRDRSPRGAFAHRLLSDIMLASPLPSSGARPRWAPRAFLDSVAPALDCAFGLDGEPDLPEAIAALVARLQADEPGAGEVGEGVREAVPA